MNSKFLKAIVEIHFYPVFSGFSYKLDIFRSINIFIISQSHEADMFKMKCFNLRHKFKKYQVDDIYTGNIRTRFIEDSQ